MPIHKTIRVQPQPFDAGHAGAMLTLGRTDVGALVSFVGLCRDEAGGLAALELEHYSGMAEAELEHIASEAESRWPLLGLIIIHRYGRIAPGEPIVLVAATSAHRQGAFAACEFIMDFLKSRAPFWKKEHRTDGTQGGWVEAKDADAQALKRWEKQ